MASKYLFHARIKVHTRLKNMKAILLRKFVMKKTKLVRCATSTLTEKLYINVIIKNVIHFQRILNKWNILLILQDWLQI